MSGRPGAVRLVGVPTRLFLESQNQQDDLVRELALIDIGSRIDECNAPPQRVAALIRDVLEEYRDVRSTTREQALAALERGEEVVTLTVPVREGIVAALQRWLRLVEEADEVCGEGALLTLAARPEVRALRRWYVEAISRAIAQGDAEPAVSYQPTGAVGT